MKIGVIGTGHISQAMLTGWLKQGMSPQELLVKGRLHSDTGTQLQQQLGIRLVTTYNELLKEAEVVVLAVPNQAAPAVLADLVTVYGHKNIPLVSVVSEVTLAQLQQSLGATAEVYRAVPNLAVATTMGITALCSSQTTTQQRLVSQVFAKLGQLVTVSEDQLLILSALAGCAPAFVAVFAEALADGAVKNGLARAEANQVIAAMLKGTASLLENQTPATLKDAVSAPGGTTIRGVAELERLGLRYAVMAALDAANA